MFLQKLFGRGGSDPSPAARIGTDIHSHLIPGVDDGSPSVEASIEMLRALHELGFSRFITTPHIMADSYRNTPEIIHRGLDVLREGIAKAGLNVQVEAAAEYYLDEEFETKLLRSPLLSFGGSKKYLLFEMSYVTRSMSLEQVIFDLQMAGYCPVLAHPERYHFFWGNDGVDLIREVADKEVKLQLNIGSLAGSYDARAGKIGKWLLKEKLISFVGTDLHRISQVSRLPKALADPDLKALIASGQLLNQSL